MTCHAEIAALRQVNKKNKNFKKGSFVCCKSGFE